MEIKPVKLIQASLDFTNEYTWEEGGAWNGYGYKWDLTITVSNPQIHSSPSTQTPNEYNGLDIKVGDWVTGTDGLQAVRIISITSATNNEVVCMVEDVDRYNIMSDQTGTGTARPSTTLGFVFSLDDEGIPILGPVASYIMEVTAQTNLYARFQYRNYLKKFIPVKQPDHGFAVGDIIQPDLGNVGKFTKSGGDLSLAIGIVTSIEEPAAEWFTFKPIGKLVENVESPLVGSYGQLFYIDPANPGALTSTRPASGIRPLYMRLDSATRAIMLDAGVEDRVSTKRFEVDAVTNGQTEFVLPSDAVVILEMSINGIDSDSFTYDVASNTVTFNPVAEGFSLENTDSVSFLYRT